jgi:hypothetical protein
MATLLLSAVGTLVGGPFGGALGALAGRQIDSAIIGSGRREGPRLKELAITSSSYGDPIARHYGHMRSSGTIIWATDLVESRETSGGGKGQPKTTTYSYSVSFAVALASRPIAGIGRIWADGNLLRGPSGDLKTGGSLRIYRGTGEQPVDPLLAAAEGSACPAFRGCAYVVFEDLQLADFGNRIPALTFEIFASEGPVALAELLETAEIDVETGGSMPELAGFTQDGGSLAAHLSVIDSVYPVTAHAGGTALSVTAEDASAEPIPLPEASRGWEEGDFGAESGHRRQRQAGEAQAPRALRYYDIARDYQPGIQRAEGRTPPGYVRTLEFPAALSADNARLLANRIAQRESWRGETLSWRITELDPAVAPGSLVRAPGVAGVWQVEGWEWRERGIELSLRRLPPVARASQPGDAGTAAVAPDLFAAPTQLQAFEVPWNGYGSSDTPSVFAAASSAGAGWKGAALYSVREGELIPIGTAGRSRAIIGQTSAALAPSGATRFESRAAIEIELVAADLLLEPATLAAIANGANRMLVGDEILQFAHAEPIGGGHWRLEGILRGRGGSEAAAARGHAPGTPVALLDERLTTLDPGVLPASGEASIAALGQADDAPVVAEIASRGWSLRPIPPVHPRQQIAVDGGWEFSWIRRARGKWEWLDGVDAPLVEEIEAYRVGLGPADSPLRSWETQVPAISFTSAESAELTANHANEHLWVRQVGEHALSDPLLLATIA